MTHDADEADAPNGEANQEPARLWPRRRDVDALDDPAESPWRTLAGRVVYRNPWLTVSEYSVIRPDGAPGIYGVVDPGDNVSIVALDAQERAWLVGEFVYPLQRMAWNVPTGAVERDEQPLAAAQRELAEEAGLAAAQWTPLGTYYLSPGIATQATYLYLARELRAVAARPEGTERITPRLLPLRAAYEACLRGEISSAPCVLALWRAWALLHGA